MDEINIPTNKHSKVIIFLLLIFLVPITASAQNDTIIVTADFNYPPFSFVDKDGNASGYDIEVINAIAEITGLKIKFELTAWDSALHHLQTGKADLITSLVYSAEREKNFDFSFPLHTEYYGIFAKKKTEIKDINDLGDKKHAVLRGDISNEVFFKTMGLLEKPVSTQSFPEAFALVNSGACDYVIAPYSLGMEIINNNNLTNLELKGPPINPSVFCFAVKQGDYELLAWINQGIEILGRNGELDKIYNKWVKYKRDDDKYKKFFFYSLVGLAIFLAIIIILFLFGYSLKKQVQKKAKEIKDKEQKSFFELQEAKKKVDMANSAKSTFLSTISHEIRTPLFAVIGYARLLNKTALTKEQADYNKKIEISGKLLLNLVNNILDLTKMEAEKIKLDPRPFNITYLITEICELESIKAIEKGIKLAYEIDKQVPEYLLGDKLLVSRILLNLVNNAIKFTEEGEVKLKVNIENLKDSGTTPKTNIIFSIKDTGIGMSQTTQKKLFSPFEQANDSNVRKHGGTGLGLALSKQLVNLMEGNILVESSLGKGSVFNVIIPFQIAEKPLPKIKNTEGKATENEMIEILLVEDNEFNAEILISELKDNNFEVTRACSGYEAIELLKSKNFQVILMDIEMPELDGFATMEKMKELGLHTAPVIALSAHDLLQEKNKAIKAGMVDYLNKPVSTSHLCRTIHKYKIDKKVEDNKTQQIDKEKGLALFENDEQKYQNALKRFKKHFSNLPDDLVTLFENDPGMLKTKAHNLKSAAKTIGATKLFETAKEQEEILRMNPQEYTKEQLLGLIDELDKVLVEID